MLMLFVTVALVHLIALMSPGPDFFFVSQTAASRSRRQAMYGVLGITLGVAIWAVVALLGLHLLLSRIAWLHSLITVGGGREHRFLRGLLTNLANPKAVIYFGSVFSLFVGDDVGAGARFGIFALILGETLLWFSLVAVVFALPASCWIFGAGEKKGNSPGRSRCRCRCRCRFALCAFALPIMIKWCSSAPAALKAMSNTLKWLMICFSAAMM